MLFADLGLREPILRAVINEGYTAATPVQAEAIPHVLAGRDVLACAQTGTGKTAAFALPILDRLASRRHAGTSGPRKSRCLVLCPTRELAVQIEQSFRTYGKNVGLSSATIFGGVGQRPQVEALRRGVEILIATPGRLLDLIEQGCADLRGIEVLVLDEADRMLDMGFINDIRKIITKLGAARQTLLFSATMPREIRALASAILRDPITVQVAPTVTTAEGIDESVYFVERHDKPALLAHLVDHLSMARAIVFTRTKHGADRVVRQLHTRGIRAEAIHGNKTQNARQRAMQNFRDNKTTLLIATDIASRGIDVDGITHVVNYDLTHEPETYVHRIGRTARAGASGAAVTFCDRDEVPNLRAVEKLIRRSIPVKGDRPNPGGQSSETSSSPREHSTHRPPRPHQKPQGHGGRDGRAHAGRRSSSSHQSATGHRSGAAPAHRPSTPATRPGGGVRQHAPIAKQPRPQRRPHPLASKH